MDQHFISIRPARQTVAWSWWAIQVLALSSALRLLTEVFAGQTDAALFQFLYLAISFTALTVILFPFLAESVRQAIRAPWPVLRAAGIAYLCCFFADWAVQYLGLRLLPHFQNLNDAAIRDMGRSAQVLTRVSTVLLAPVAEELVHRGLLFGTVWEKKPWAAYLLSTLVFSGVHVAGFVGQYSPGEFLFAFLQYVPASLCLCWSYARSKNILSPILLHMTINQIANLSLR